MSRWDGTLTIRRTSVVVTLLVVSVLVLTACAGSASPSPSPQSQLASSTASAIPTAASPSINRAIGQIVFEDWIIDVQRHQLYIGQADGSNVRRLVTSAFDDARPSFSPDGTTVLFTRLGDGPDQLYFVNVDGTNLRPLAVCTGGCGNEAFSDAWSPDGSRLAVRRIEGFGTATPQVNLWIMNLDETDLVQVTNNPAGSLLEDDRPAWSPDGRHLVFVRYDHNVTPQRGAIFTVNIDGTQLTQVTPWELDANEPDWSPDGTLIAFNAPGESLVPGREENIFIIHPEGTGLVQLTAHMAAGPDGSQGTFDPSWSPDGTQLIFTHIPSTDGLADLYVINADGTGLHVLAKTTDLNEGHAVWGVYPAS
jgi:Tol biopolymer transport system component